MAKQTLVPPKAGEIWKDNDPRRQAVPRYVRVVAVGDELATVVTCGPNGEDVENNARKTTIALKRFRPTHSGYVHVPSLADGGEIPAGKTYIVGENSGCSGVPGPTAEVTEPVRDYQPGDTIVVNNTVHTLQDDGHTFKAQEESIPPVMGGMPQDVKQVDKRDIRRSGGMATI